MVCHKMIFFGSEGGQEGGAVRILDKEGEVWSKPEGKQGFS